MNLHLSQLLDTWKSLKVLILGDAMLDCYLDGSSSRLSQEAPIPIVTVTQCEDLPGGAANTAANVASMGGEALLLSVIGDDVEGKRLQDVLQQRGVVTSCLVACTSRHTLVKQRVLGNSQLLARFDQGSTEAIALEVEQKVVDQLKALFPKCDAVIISDYGYGTITPRIIETLATLQASYSRTLVVDSKRLEAYQKVGVTAVKPNYNETIRLLGLPQQTSERFEQIIHHRDRLLHLTGASIIAATLDVEGAVIFEREQSPLRTHAQPAPFSHTAGAGDTYVSVFTLALASKAATATAASLAATAAAVVVNQAKTTTCSIEELGQACVEPTKLISSSFDLAIHIQHYRSTGRRIVFTNGCFDILHVGHVTHLMQAKALGDVLIIGINTDESIQELKGMERPVNPLNDRLIVLSALGCVDHVVPFAGLTPHNLIQIIRPDIYVKGGDYTRETLPEVELVEALGGSGANLPHIGDRSTSRLIQQIRAVQNCHYTPYVKSP